MYTKAKNARDDHLKHATNWKEFMEALNGKNICLAKWCDTVACEKKVKEQSKEESLAKMKEANDDEVTLTGSAKTLCVPYELGKQDGFTADDKCFFCGE